MRLLASVLAAVLLLAPSLSARAEDPQKAAREAYKRATRLYDFGEYQKALDAFKEAYAHVEDATLLFNIAQCHRQLGQNQEAIRVYKSFLRRAPDAPQREEVKSLMAKLEKLVAEQSKVTASPPEGVAAKAPEPAPPPPAAEPPPAATAPALAPAPAVEKKPAYKKPWVWITVAAVVVVGVGLGVGLGLGLQPKTPTANTDFGTRDFQ